MNPPKGMFLVLGLVLALIAAACGDDDTAATTTTAAPATTTATTETPGEFEPVGTDLTTPLPAGDAATGEQLFGPMSTDGVGFSCTACHLLEELTEEFLETFPVQIDAPSMFGIAERAGTTREGYSAEEYLRESIVLPCEFLAEGPVCLMPRNFGERLDAQDVADLIAFLMTQSG